MSIKLNKSQRRAVCRLVRAACIESSDHHLVKYDIEQYDSGSLYVSIVCRPLGVTGSLGRALLTKRGAFYIGQRGRVEALERSKSASVAQARQHPEIFGWSY